MARCCSATDPADDLPATTCWCHGENTFVPDERIIYGTDSLTSNIAFGAVADTSTTSLRTRTKSLSTYWHNDEIFPGSTGELTITDVMLAAHGTVTIAQDGKSVIYKPNDDFFGQDQFTYSCQRRHRHGPGRGNRQCVGSQ